jgi:hypothetical protein
MPLRVSFVLNEEPIAKLWAKKKGENGLKGAARAQTAPQGRLMDNLGLMGHRLRKSLRSPCICYIARRDPINSLKVRVYKAPSLGG